MGNSKFISMFERKVKATIKRFKLLNKSDKVAVLVSGGKDSTVVLYLLHKFGYTVSALHMNLGIGDWSNKNEQNVRDFCSGLGVPLTVLNFKELTGRSMRELRDIMRLKKGRRLCYTCGITRRQIFNKVAREIGATRVATGHNLDDEAQSALMNILTGNTIAILRFGPVANSSASSRLVPRIKPLFFCLESDVKCYSKLHNFPVLYQPCPCSYDAFRGEVEKFLNSYGSASNNLKLAVVQNSLKLEKVLRIPALKALKACSVCGEPSSREVCKACEIFAFSV